MGDIDKVTWYAMGLMLTGIGLAWSYVRYQRKGLTAGVRAVAWSLLPVALAFTGTLKLAGEIVDDIGRWATHLVFSPLVWLGLALGGVSVVLFGASGFLAKRGGAKETPAGKQLPTTPSGKAAAPVDSDLDDIEAILRKHGIQ